MWLTFSVVLNIFLLVIGWALTVSLFNARDREDLWRGFYNSERAKMESLIIQLQKFKDVYIETIYRDSMVIKENKEKIDE